MEKSALVPCHQLADRTVWAKADFQSQAFIYLSDNRVCAERGRKGKQRAVAVEVGTVPRPRQQGHAVWWGLAVIPLLKV